MSCVTLVKAAMARFLFGMHALVTVWRVVSQEEDSYWKLAIGILVQALEGFHALCYRKGEELSWFCPSVFIYLASIVPSIWILELKTNRREMLCLYIKIVQDSFESDEGSIRSKMIMDMMQIKRGDLEEASETCKHIPISKETSDALFVTTEVGLKEILDIDINIALRPEQWTKILEQVVLVVLILGRWLLPKGRLTRDQFSQLMLVYIGMAADIVEVFEAFREAKVMLEPTLTYAILGVWSWSLLQFCLVLGSGHRGRKTRMTSLAPEHHLDSELSDNEDETTSSSHRSSPRLRKTRFLKSNPRRARSASVYSVSNPAEEKKKRLKMDMIMITTALVLQDLPFFCLRMTLIFGFRVISHMNIFFTCKNTLVILLQVYRLLVLCLERRPQYRRQSRLFSLIPPMSYTTTSEEEKASKESDNSINDTDESDKRSSNEQFQPNQITTNQDNYNDNDESIKQLKPILLIDEERKKGITQNQIINCTASERRNIRNKRTRFRQRSPTTTVSEEIPMTTSDDPEEFSLDGMSEEQLHTEIQTNRRSREIPNKDSPINIKRNISKPLIHEAQTLVVSSSCVGGQPHIKVNKLSPKSRKISREEIGEMVREREQRWRKSHEMQGKKSRAQTLV